MKMKKLMAVVAGTVSIGTLAGGIYSFAVENKASTDGVSMENGYIKLTVEENSGSAEYLRYRLDTTGGQINNSSDNDKNLTYNRFFTGYTTININGKNYVYGCGSDVSEPGYDVENKRHISAQKFGDVVIEQTLVFSEGYTPEYDDMLKISYKVIEAGENDSVGVRILIDPAIENDDMLNASAENVKVMKEAVFNSSVPKNWKAEKTMDSTVAAYGLTDKTDLKPSSITFADWENIYDVLWDYNPDINYGITDLGVAVEWNPVADAESKEFATYYGIRNYANTGATSEVHLNSPKTGVTLSSKIIALLAVSAVSAGGCLILGRKEKKDEK